MHVCVLVCVCMCVCVCVCVGGGGVFLSESLNESCFFTFFRTLNVTYAEVKLGLVVGMTKQMSDGMEVDLVNC